jgi:hypothetical protein
VEGPTSDERETVATDLAHDNRKDTFDCETFPLKASRPSACIQGGSLELQEKGTSEAVL